MQLATLDKSGSEAAPWLQGRIARAFSSNSLVNRDLKQRRRDTICDGIYDILRNASLMRMPNSKGTS